VLRKIVLSHAIGVVYLKHDEILGQHRHPVGAREWVRLYWLTADISPHVDDGPAAPSLDSSEHFLGQERLVADNGTHRVVELGRLGQLPQPLRCAGERVVAVHEPRGLLHCLWPSNLTQARRIASLRANVVVECSDPPRARRFCNARLAVTVVPGQRINTRFASSATVDVKIVRKKNVSSELRVVDHGEHR
jgi:hypothetical protein